MTLPENINLIETEEGKNLLPDQIEDKNLDEEIKNAPAEETGEDQTIDDENKEDSSHAVSDEKTRPSTRDERKSKYAAIADKMAAQAELERVKVMLKQTLDNSAFYFKENADIRLEKAQAQRIQALEDMDREALIKADMEVQVALRQKDNLEQLEIEEQRRSAETQANPAAQTGAEYRLNMLEQERLEDFFDDYPELHPRSTTFNKALYEQVDSYSKQLPNKYLSEQYFESLYNYMDNLEKKSATSPVRATAAAHAQTSRPQEMTAPIGPVKGGQRPSGNNAPAPKYTLTANEKFWLERGEIKLEALLKEKERLKTIEQRGK